MTLDALLRDAAAALGRPDPLATLAQQQAAAVAQARARLAGSLPPATWAALKVDPARALPVEPWGTILHATGEPIVGDISLHVEIGYTRAGEEELVHLSLYPALAVAFDDWQGEHGAHATLPPDEPAPNTTRVGRCLLAAIEAHQRLLVGLAES